MLLLSYLNASFVVEKDRKLELYYLVPHNANNDLQHTIAQKKKFSIKDFFIICDQIRSFMWIWSQLLKKSLMENFIVLCSAQCEKDIHLLVKSSIIRQKGEFQNWCFRKTKCTKFSKKLTFSVRVRG